MFFSGNLIKCVGMPSSNDNGNIKKTNTNKTASSILRIFHLFRHKNGKESFLIRMKSQDTKDFFSRFTLSPVKASNRPFAANDHVVQNPPCCRASSLLFPHWDIKSKASQASLVQVSLFQCPSAGIMSLPSSMADFVPRDL